MINSQKATLKVGSDIISATLFTPEKSNGSGVIFVHGWGSSQAGYTERASSLCKLGITCLTIDLRGFGESGGDFAKLSILDHLNDLYAAYDYIKGFGIKNISACGASYGCALCTLLTQKRKIRSLVLRAPGIYPNDIFNKTGWTNENLLLKEIWKFKTKKDFSESRIIKCLNNFMNPVLVVGSTDDTKIPKLVVEEYYKEAVNAINSELIWIQGGDHPLSNQKHKEEYIRILVGWFSNLI